ncbi:MAG: GNAT family N-acetyltransferase [Nitrospiraceae bacterium]
MGEVRLRQLGLNEVDVALDFVRAYFAHDGLAFDQAVAVAVRQLLSDPSLGRFWAIVRGEEMVGYAVLTFGFDHEFGGRTGLLTDFYLSEAWRGQGIGSLALEAIELEARALGLRALDLYVLDANPNARRLYLRRGFKPMVGRAPLTKPLA